MILIEDCRIGNLVSHKYDGIIKGWQHHKISHEDIYSIGCGSLRYKPILITEELLKEYSFFLSDRFNGYREYEYSGSGFFLNWNIKESKIDSVCLLGDYVNYTVELKYFHQLQNLHYALTGFEIKRV